MKAKRDKKAEASIAKAIVQLSIMTQQQREEAFVQAENNAAKCHHCAVSLAVLARFLSSTAARANDPEMEWFQNN